MKKLLVALLLALGVVVAIVAVRTATFGAPAFEPAPDLGLEVDAAAVAGRVGEAIRIRTLSAPPGEPFDCAPFLELHGWLQRTYPKAHEVLKREVFGSCSLLYRWPGQDPSLAPVMLMAHLDVVPVTPGTEGDWTHAPFSGAVADGWIWGRGAIDVKSGVVGIMEAVEALASRGERPRRTVMIAFGEDEEVGGKRGNVRIANMLRDSRTRLHWVLDEGLVVTDGIMPGATQPIALIGIAEKGYATVELTVEASGGHSSMPPRETAVGILSGAVHRLETQPFPGGLDGPLSAMFEHVSGALPFGQRLAMANLWLLGGVVESKLSASPTTDALLRTTTAPTMLRAGVQENILAQRARAVVNFRIHPRDTVESVVARVRTVVADERVKVRAMGETLDGNPSPVSSIDGPGYRTVARAIRRVFPEAAVGPSLFIAATDSRHYVPLADNVYRFMPMVMTPSERGRAHGTNERLSVENMAQYVRFYAQVLAGIE
jgi:carboxypeptidase PM20D1